MGLLGLPDLAPNGDMTDLAMIGGLLGRRIGEGGPLPLVLQAMAAKNAQQNQERLNRANDLQQLQGTYNLLKQQEFGRLIQAQQSGQPYTPNPALGQLEARMTELLGKSNLSGSMMPSPQQAPVSSAPMPQASASPSQAPTMQSPAQSAPMSPPQQMQSLGIGGPAAGIPAQVWLAQDPSGKSYLAALQKDREPINVRPGGTVAAMGPDGKYSSAFFAPQLGPGMQPTRGPDGNVASADLIPNYLQGLAAVKSAESGATAAGQLPFKTPTVVNTPGAPTLMTPQQQITAATGRDPLSPVVSPEVQSARNAQQLALLQRERQSASDPSQLQALDTQIQALTRAQSAGTPFAYSTNRGLTLQDNTAQEAQKTLGESVGKEAGNVFITGAASVQGKKLLSGMSDLVKSYEPGKFQPLQATLAAYAQGIGMPEDFANKIFRTNVGDIQALTSSAIQMAGKLTRQTDAQPSQLQFLKTLESMPMAERTPQGFARIMDYLNSVHDYNIDKMVALQQYLGKNNGDPSGFEAAWAKQSRDMPFVWNRVASNAPGNTGVKSVDPLTVNVNGKNYRFPSAQAAQAFKQQAGIQ